MKTAIVLKQGYIIEDRGKKAVIIPFNRYKGLMKKIEDMEDALDALKAKKYARDFFRYTDVRKGLKSKGKL